jgi:excisionase family DNA binding protein
MSTHPESPAYGRSRTELLTVNELARLFRVSRGSVYRLVNSGDLRAVRVGERLRFRSADIDAYLERVT